MVAEMITYIIYIYLLLYLFINIKPKLMYFIIFYFICFVWTYYIANGCKQELINIDIFKIGVVGGYSFLCVGALYFINKTWKIYKKNIFFILFLLSMPFIYKTFLEVFESFWKCGKSHSFNVASHIYYSVIFILICLIYGLVFKGKKIKKLF
jgi:hypothetical protein